MVTQPQQYQPLTEEELLLLSTFEKRLQRWKAVSGIICRYYGQDARFVTIEEAHLDDTVFFHFRVEDAQRRACHVDRTACEVLGYIDSLGLIDKAYEVEDVSELTEEQWEHVEENLYTYIQFDEKVPYIVPRIPNTYDLACPPIRNACYPVLFVFDGQQFQRLKFDIAKAWSQAHHAYKLWERLRAVIPKYYGVHAGFVDVTIEENYQTGVSSVLEIEVTAIGGGYKLQPDIASPGYREWKEAYLTRSGAWSDQLLNVFVREEAAWAERQNLIKIDTEARARGKAMSWESFDHGLSLSIYRMTQAINERIIEEIGFPPVDAIYDVQNPPSVPDHPTIYRLIDEPFLPGVVNHEMS